MELALPLRLLIAFQKSLREGLRVAKKLFLDALRALVRVIRCILAYYLCSLVHALTNQSLRYHNSSKGLTIQSTSIFT